MPPIPARTLAAYRRTTYRAGPHHVRVGRRCPGLDDWLHRQRSQAGVFVTASNPRSRTMPPGWNRRMGLRLREALRAVPVLPGTSGTGRWREDQLFAAMAPRRATVIARRFRQNAVVALRRGLPARLVLL